MPERKRKPYNLVKVNPTKSQAIKYLEKHNEQ